MGVRESYIEQALDHAKAYVAAINDALAAAGLPAYHDPERPPDVYSSGLFGRSALDHHSARCLVRVAEIAADHLHSPHLGLLLDNPYRVAFVPAHFARPLETIASDRIGGENVGLWVGSCLGLLSELVGAAPALGIPLDGGSLADETASRINEFETLFEGDSLEFAENERTAWLVLFEGARLATQHHVALALAG